jgi:hypothetical protein
MFVDFLRLALGLFVNVLYRTGILRRAVYPTPLLSHAFNMANVLYILTIYVHQTTLQVTPHFLIQLQKM